MPICKPSKKTDELYKDWLIYSPNVSCQSTGNTPPNSDSVKKPNSDAPENVCKEQLDLFFDRGGNSTS